MQSPRDDAGAATCAQATRGSTTGAQQTDENREANCQHQKKCSDKTIAELERFEERHEQLSRNVNNLSGTVTNSQHLQAELVELQKQCTEMLDCRHSSSAEQKRCRVCKIKLSRLEQSDKNQTRRNRLQRLQQIVRALMSFQDSVAGMLNEPQFQRDVIKELNDILEI